MYEVIIVLDAYTLTVNHKFALLENAKRAADDLSGFQGVSDTAVYQTLATLAYGTAGARRDRPQETPNE